MSNFFNPNARLTEDQQRAFLASRGCSSRMVGGSFNSFCSMLFALKGVAIHSDVQGPADVKLGSVFPTDYHPTYAEVFETISRQTHTTMRYDPERNYWVFDPPARPLPFALDLADGWKAQDRGLYVCCVPPIAPVGLDVYMLGRYSSDAPDPDLDRRIRDGHAVRFLGPLGKAEVADMTPVNVAGVEAFFYQTSAVPKPNTTWRQWVFVADGQCFGIASSIDFSHEERLWPQVQAMVRSFRLV